MNVDLGMDVVTELVHRVATMSANEGGHHAIAAARARGQDASVGATQATWGSVAQSDGTGRWIGRWRGGWAAAAVSARQRSRVDGVAQGRDPDEGRDPFL